MDRTGQTWDVNGIIVYLIIGPSGAELKHPVMVLWATKGYEAAYLTGSIGILWENKEYPLESRPRQYTRLG